MQKGRYAMDELSLLVARGEDAGVDVEGEEVRIYGIKVAEYFLRK
jgi:hypothetical protein